MFHAECVFHHALNRGCTGGDPQLVIAELTHDAPLVTVDEPTESITELRMGIECLLDVLARIFCASQVEEVAGHDEHSGPFPSIEGAGDLCGGCCRGRVQRGCQEEVTHHHHAAADGHVELRGPERWAGDGAIGLAPPRYGDWPGAQVEPVASSGLLREGRHGQSIVDGAHR